MRYLPPVYSPLRWNALCSAAVAERSRSAPLHLQAAREALAQHYSGFDVLLVNSGTAALTLALELALERAPASPARRLVAVPAYACPDVGTAAVGAQADLALYDLDPHTLEPDWHSVKVALERGARVVMVAHLYGRVVDLSPAHELANAFGAIVVEDAAQHAGGSIRGLRGGSQASLGVLSFGRGKGLNAGGGGALLSRSRDQWPVPKVESGSPASSAALLLAAAADILAHPVLYGIPARLPGLGVGSTEYHAPGPRAPITAAQASLLSHGLQHEPAELALRRRRESMYLDELTDRPDGRLVVPARRSESGALRTPVFLGPDFSGDRSVLHALGVVRSYPRTLAAYPQLASVLINSGEAMPGSEWLAARTYTLPTHRHVREGDAAAILQLLAAG